MKTIYRNKGCCLHANDATAKSLKIYTSRPYTVYNEGSLLHIGVKKQKIRFLQWNHILEETSLTDRHNVTGCQQSTACNIINAYIILLLYLFLLPSGNIFLTVLAAPRKKLSPPHAGNNPIHCHTKKQRVINYRQWPW